MMKIGILGASSQVGSSVALYFKKFPEAEVTCFIRSSYSEIFFDLFEIDYIYIDLKSTSFNKRIGEMDIVLDFAYPTGQLNEILAHSKKNIERTLSLMKKGSMFFYMSSIMAYGMPDHEKWIKNYSIARNSYSYIKREIEKFTLSAGKKYGISIYNFRLGQVHGFLQSVNSSFVKRLSETDIALIDGDSNDKVNITFIYSICEAVINAAKNNQKPGVYTLVFNPQWTLHDLYDFYISYYNMPTRLEFRPSENKRKRRKSLIQYGIQLARPYRSFLETYVLMKAPRLSTSIKGKFRQNEFLTSVGRNAERNYIDFNLLGTPSLQMINGLTVKKESIEQIEKQMESHYNSVIIANSK